MTGADLSPHAAVDPAIEPDFVFGDRYPERIEVYETIAALSRRARSERPVVCDLAYGSDPRERLDLFPGPAEAPVVAFIHGGYWRSQERSAYAFVAPALLDRGVSVAVLGYPLAPAAPLARILGGLTRALHWLRAEGRRHGAGTGPLYLAGHSAGGHLAAALAAGIGTGDVAPVPVAGCLCLSGIFDLRPILSTSINRDLGLDAAGAEALSPLLQPPGSGWLIAAYGAQETAPFRLQAERQTDHWRKGGALAELLPVPGRNHYNVLLELAQSESAVLAAFSEKMTAGGP